MEFKELETDRLYLKKINEHYSKDLFEYLSKDEVTRYLGQSSFKNINEVYEMIVKLEDKFKEKRGIMWGLVLKENNKLIGTMGYDCICLHNKRADIGYNINSDYWKRGLASEAINEILKFGFYNINLNRIGAVVFPENVASYTLLKKIGFKKEGLLRDYIIQDNIQRNTIVFSLLKKEF
ncbi:GNAT family N-acetyltransferase [Romboutsia sp. 1001713B170131_170501_G6]|uniref:GNAT family N-acetyltransferase n=1 Tax=Romboutsia sp. 1001713B170131_170501_G6 TaxID=2787108 RepID=UPI0018AB760D